MKKYNYRSIFKLLLVSALLLLCSACEKPAPEPDWPDISGNLTFKDNYKFPPDQLVLDWGMYDVGLNWNIEPRRESQEDIQPEDTFVFHTITNATGDIAAMLAMNYFFSPDDKNSSLFFDYLEQTKEDYKRFEEKDWPLLWQLLGLLFDRQETIETLGKQCLSYTNNYKENRNNTQTGGLLEWRGRQDDTHCIVRFTWHGGFGDYVLSGIVLNSPPSYAFELDDTASYRIKEDNYPQKLSKTAEIDLNAAFESDIGQHIVRGYLDRLEPNDDILDTTTLLDFPKNTDQYQKALLVDETGSLPVYILPTSLAESELKEERLHFLTIISAPDPFCVIDLSSTNVDIFD